MSRNNNKSKLPSDAVEAMKKLCETLGVTKKDLELLRKSEKIQGVVQAIVDRYQMRVRLPTSRMTYKDWNEFWDV
ncbi:MAG: hypothetical protein AAB389_01190 [Patescibacteria group bacterium]